MQHAGTAVAVPFTPRDLRRHSSFERLEPDAQRLGQPQRLTQLRRRRRIDAVERCCERVERLPHLREHAFSLQGTVFQTNVISCKRMLQCRYGGSPTLSVQPAVLVVVGPGRPCGRRNGQSGHSRRSSDRWSCS